MATIQVPRAANPFDLWAGKEQVVDLVNRLNGILEDASWSLYGWQKHYNDKHDRRIALLLRSTSLCLYAEYKRCTDICGSIFAYGDGQSCPGMSILGTSYADQGDIARLQLLTIYLDLSKWISKLQCRSLLEISHRDHGQWTPIKDEVFSVVEKAQLDTVQALSDACDRLKILAHKPAMPDFHAAMWGFSTRSHSSSYSLQLDASGFPPNFRAASVLDCIRHNLPPSITPIDKPALPPCVGNVLANRDRFAWVCTTCPYYIAGTTKADTMTDDTGIVKVRWGMFKTLTLSFKPHLIAQNHADAREIAYDPSLSTAQPSLECRVCKETIALGHEDWERHFGRHQKHDILHAYPTKSLC